MGGMTDCRGFTTGRGLSPWQVSLLSESQGEPHAVFDVAVPFFSG